MIRPNQADLAELMNTAIVGGPSTMFKRHSEVGLIVVRMPDYGAEVLPCRALVGFDTNSLYPWDIVQDMPILSCQVRSEPDYALDAEAASHGYGPRHSRASLHWLAYEAEVCRLEGLLHATSWPEMRLGLRHLPVDDYHPNTATVFQFHSCLFHGHDCRKFEDAWFCTERGGSTPKGMKTTWGPLVATCLWPSEIESARPLSTPTPAQRRW